MKYFRTAFLLIISTVSAASMNADDWGSAQVYELQSTLWVSAKSGLRVRESPDQNSKQITSLKYGTTVTVIEQGNDMVMISNSKSYWYRINYDSPDGEKTGWAFGGFLRNFDPAPLSLTRENIRGCWVFLNGIDNTYYITFSENGTFTIDGGPEYRAGNWLIKGNKQLILNYNFDFNGGGENAETRKIKYTEKWEISLLTTGYMERVYSDGCSQQRMKKR